MANEKSQFLRRISIFKEVVNLFGNIRAKIRYYLNQKELVKSVLE